VRAVNREEPLGKRIAKRVAKNLAQFLKHFALGLIEAAKDADIYVPHYETCWCPQDSDYCTCERRGMVPKTLLTTTICTCYGEQCTCPEQ
jgi:hypothetical protein